MITRQITINTQQKTPIFWSTFLYLNVNKKENITQFTGAKLIGVRGTFWGKTGSIIAVPFWKYWFEYRERLPFRTLGSVPHCGTCLCSNCWDQIPRTCHVISRLFTSITPWYFLDFAFYVKCSYLVNIKPYHSRICWYKKCTVQNILALLTRQFLRVVFSKAPSTAISYLTV